MNHLDDDDASKQSSIREIRNFPYTPSAASAASTSSLSVFSADGKSSQSSATSSARSGSPAWDPDSNNYQGAPSENSSQAFQAVRIQQQHAVHVRQIIPSEAAVAPELRLNPRRTQPSAQADECEGKSIIRAPPPLVRQRDRKDNFVESLVGKPISPNFPWVSSLTFASVTKTPLPK